MILLLDNYDSFTYNLYDYLLQLQVAVAVVRNDEITIEQIEELQPTAIIISPGPKRPAAAGITMAIIRRFYQQLPMLGICLGHQALGEFFGAKLVRSPIPMHGITSMVSHAGDKIFDSVPSPFEAMRYHSLELTEIGGTALNIIATTIDGTVMGIKHQNLPLYGLQFHPESILTSVGKQLLTNWVGMLVAHKK